MNIPKQKFRELVFQMLYGHDMGQTSDIDLCSLLKEELSTTTAIAREALDRVNQIKAKLPEIDAMIEKTSVAYDLDRIHSVERNVIRLGLFELFYDETIPPKVAIAEALRLSKKFGTPESTSYVNAILDTIYKKSLT